MGLWELHSPNIKVSDLVIPVEELILLQFI